jgi:hypothetical protein
MNLNSKIFDWLIFGAEWGIDSYIQDWKKQWPLGALTFGMKDNSQGRIIVQKNSIRDINSTVHLDFNFEMNSNIKLTGALGANMLKQIREFNNTEGSDFIRDEIYEINNCKNHDKSYFKRDYRLMSLNIKGGISIKKAVNLNLTGMSYKTQEEIEDSHFIYTISSSFIFTEIINSLHSPSFSYGNIRFSWARADENSGLESVYNYIAGASVKKNDKLKYGLSRSLETGIDLGFFNNRILFDMTYYFIRTNDQIVPVGMGSGTGYDYKLVNLGRNSNRGLEIGADFDVIRRNTGLNWRINFNFARNYSEIEELDDPITSMELYHHPGYSVQLYIKKGEPFGSIVARKNARSPQGEKIVESNGSYAYEPVPSVVGNISPDWTGSISNAFSYKNWSLCFLIDFVQGYQFYSDTKLLMNIFGTGSWTSEGRRIKDVDDQGNQLPLIGIVPGVVEVPGAVVNDVAYQPNVLAVDGFSYWGRRRGEEFIEDASFIRLQELEIGYRLNLQKNKLSIPLRIALIGRNLVILNHSLNNLGVSSESIHSPAMCEQGIQLPSLPPVRTMGISFEISL